MEGYIDKFNQFEKCVVYDFWLGNGGIGDCIKFFMLFLDTCIKQNARLYYKKNNIPIEKYIKLKHEQMYLTQEELGQMQNITVVTPNMYYHVQDQYTYSIKVNEVFYFTEQVLDNSAKLLRLPENVTNYMSIHLRLGDKYLETDPCFVLCHHDSRFFNEEKICQFIEQHPNEAIFFCCDNKSFKLKLKGRFNNLLVSTCAIGHTSLSNTTEQQILDAVSEMHILSNSTQLYCGSLSGFSLVAAKFQNIPLFNLY